MSEQDRTIIDVGPLADALTAKKEAEERVEGLHWVIGLGSIGIVVIHALVEALRFGP